MQNVIQVLLNMNWAEWAISIQLLIAGLIAVLKLIPGNQGEAQLEAAANFISKLIKK